MIYIAWIAPILKVDRSLPLLPQFPNGHQCVCDHTDHLVHASSLTSVSQACYMLLYTFSMLSLYGVHRKI